MSLGDSCRNAVLLLGTLRSHVWGEEMRITRAVSCTVLRGRLDASPREDEQAKGAKAA